MGRPVDPLSPYRVSIHRNGNYNYASTQINRFNSETGQKEHKRIHWGRLTEENKFIPGNEFISASQEIRSKLIFPKEWDLSEIEIYCKNNCSNENNELKFVFEFQNYLYGDIWLLEMVAKKTGVYDDLMSVFLNDKEKVNKILTLAYFLFSGYKNYNHTSNWQKIVKTPCQSILLPYDITRFTQKITQSDRFNFFKLRTERMKDREICSVDSTSRSAYGHCLPDIKFGNNKEKLPLPQTLEVVVYTLSGHEPIYFRTFQGNAPDSRTLDIILYELDSAGYKDPILITDRGYESTKNLEKYIEGNKKAIICSKIGQKHIKEFIKSFNDYSYYPREMALDTKTGLYYIQKKIEYKFTDSNGNVINAENLKLNLYFNPIKRCEELLDLDIDLNNQAESLDYLKSNAINIDDESALDKEFPLYIVKYNKFTILEKYEEKNHQKNKYIDKLNNLISTKEAIQDKSELEKDYVDYNLTFKSITIITEFERNEKKYNDKILCSGFFATTMVNLNIGPLEAYNHYLLRDEQEKYFHMMKGVMNSNRQRSSSQAGKDGRLFILFVAQIIGCYIDQIRKTKLTKYHSISSILEEMRSIRYIKHPNFPAKISPFVSKQLEICEAFEFDIPEGCAPESPPRDQNRG
ncbi:MAG: transposase [Desulfovibrio sp.]|nr:transposase [Desulfovibrio sp.]